MRVSSQMLHWSALANLRRNSEALARAQDEATSGRRVRTMSDDPVDGAQVLRLNSDLRDIDRYRRAATAATTKLSAENVVLGSVRDLIRQAKELAMGAATASPSDPERQMAVIQLAQIRQQVLSLANTKVGSEYLFAGGRATTPPFQADGTYTGDGTLRLAEIDSGVQVQTNHPGDMVYSGAIQAIDVLSQQLQTGTASDVQAAVPGLDAAEEHFLGLQTEIGGILRQIDDTGKHLARRSSNLLDRLEAVRDVDPAEAITKLLAAQAAMERAYSVVGKVLSTNLLSQT
jgi:flagellar hook-associated protein 3 FlgL